MSGKKRVLFIATEMSPYLELTEYAEIINKLAIKSNDTGFEVRCIMPRFGVINERRHRLHEVVRLSGINVSINDDDFPLQIKVASLPNARLQVYFLENEELFKRKFIFNGEDDKWFDDNGLRTAFFCKSALETVKKFGWSPDIIHCSGWMTGLIPLYLKTHYKREPVFIHSKTIFTLEANSFKDSLGKDLVKLSNLQGAIKPKEIEIFSAANNMGMLKGGAAYSDAIVFGSNNIDKKLTEEFSKAKGKKILPFQGWNTDLSEYMELYNELTSK
ncbi:MAG: glycogen/starch synthase [Chitinophagaceae bacterium]|jgi:starch synthase|nr:glycogen/starch synthase [Chitinophagaceae bacterium]